MWEQCFLPGSYCKEKAEDFCFKLEGQCLKGSWEGFNFKLLLRQFMKLYYGFEFGKGSFLRTTRKDMSAAGEGTGLALVGHLDHEAMQRGKRTGGRKLMPFELT